jgi:RNA polymerase sigma-70 factor (ECF subfamily)
MADSAITFGSDAIGFDWMGRRMTGRPADAAVSAPASDWTDAELVRVCLEGQTCAFDIIVERHRRAIYQLCYRFVGRHEDASDLSQDVFLRAYRGLGRFRGDASLATWLYRIGVNVCLNKVAARGPMLMSLDATAPMTAPGDDPAAAALRQERGQRVRAAIATLPRKQRVTLILRVYQELSHKEIAGVLRTTEGAVKANVFHALGNLKKALKSPDAE